MNKFFWDKLPANHPSPISRDECHIWRVDLRHVNKNDLQINTLSEEEQKRLNTFKFAKDRFRYGVTHSVKRCILADYLSERPEKLVFTLGKYGKPAILSRQNWLNLQFNISHSHQLILFAITKEDAIGIDVEYHTRVIDSAAIESISKLIFSPLEKRHFSTLKNDREKRDIFFRFWTQKEAYLKAKGLSLTTDLVLTSTEIGRQPINTWFKIPAENEQEQAWNLLPLNVGEFYSASLVVANYKKRLSAYKISTLRNLRLYPVRLNS